ncbi:nineteen complex-related protein 2-domain-containing protein [Cladorrhinum samala]|uniref:Nineteen complex-related protein 2-domain-containing protein n=1 Tax=Cladorrhinum samala TaxID=585594 RepID=A0AAV9HZU8_9PEZI|nr:nineteen complex-related protein 2-domain-containing protein [Cladorrhinum samala]
MAPFSAKKKARIIQTFDDDDGDLTPTSPNTSEEPQSDQPPVARIKFRSKPNKSSALRKSTTITDDADNNQAASAAATADEDDDASGAPVVVRPAISRAGSTKQKKRPGASSRLSFGGPSDGGADEDSAATEKPFTPKKPLGQRALENNALRRSASLQNLSSNLPIRFGGVDEDRPKYSKEYLEELQSSTPATPANIQMPDEDEMQLDESELDGAVVVAQPSSSSLIPSNPDPVAHVLSAAEIRERKDRRARLAREQDFIALDEEESNSESEQFQSSRATVDIASSRKKKKSKSETSRLIAEDEDLGEGYDEFVQDDRLALGKKAEKEAARRHRAEMAELINAAESDAASDESEAERRAAYEAAQRRAGMDGLHKPEEDVDMDMGPDSVPRMKPLPKLNDVLARMKDILDGLEREVSRKGKTIEMLEKERREIEEREKEVQEILNQAGAKYQEVVGGGVEGAAGEVAKLVQESLAGGAGAAAGRSPLRPLPPGFAADVPMERGLESFGTPTRREDEDMTG